MDKSITSREYRLFLKELRAARERAGISQIEVAERLNETQSFVSKCERGERRLDIIEVRAFCRAIGTSLPGFALGLERLLETSGRPPTGSKARKTSPIVLVPPPRKTPR